MQVQCNNKKDVLDGHYPLEELFNEKALRDVHKPLTEKSDKELESNILHAQMLREKSLKNIAKNIAILRVRMSDYRFKKLLKRQSLSKDFAEKLIDLGTTLLEGGK